LEKNLPKKEVKNPACKEKSKGHNWPQIRPNPTKFERFQPNP